MNQESLPGASNALTFGIISIVASLFCCGPFGAIFSFIGLSNGKKAEKLYQENPGTYSGYENVKTGQDTFLYRYWVISIHAHNYHHLLWCHCSHICLRKLLIRRFIVKKKALINYQGLSFYFSNCSSVLVIIETQSNNCSLFITKGGAKRMILP